MPHQLDDSLIEDYHRRGVTVFRGIVPPSLLADLRRVTDEGRRRAREGQGAQTQRFQPVAKYDLELQPFHDFRELPELREAVSFVLSPAHTYADVNLMGVLLEPAELPWSTPWHRDWRDNVPYADLREWEAVFSDFRYLNQSNCPLYADASLWVVPGSHLRPDLPRERQRFPTRPISGPELDGLGSEARERACLEYARSLPGAERLHLNAGDFALYRSTLWHLGSYVPYVKRATLHDFIDTPEYVAWRTEQLAEAARRKETGHPAWEWSLGHTGGAVE